ncbi:UDP-2,3-diacylglucosamine diphosphatase [Desulfuromonas acetoxidans]|uniref:Metallophosphoesterase n=1 Tax=Desulfuromonas acetoxidans (strain DSM 684 / 11070) TaxID=281689 RepID=Q1K0X0_DESA6|nr:UDP-2,3-diacylglucosamine diphosphatase [Desulfuromonas acetoxidans]EAT16238.1 metallophosphoesterase [Desulfuromonas acetoxidans DSM 684]NVD23068.1 UDP-2,3-diacylglucosamine diphosphatase [Desulfuromonas acetoxidans]NVE15691.1 UDP-2,3-diacylglucosamine diphosphatase [Desulfuromonas acetoxidans]
MKDLFIADAHLIRPDDAAYRHLLSFLQQQRGQVRTLILLGDIFEFWVGYRHCVFSAYLPLLHELQQLQASGTRIVMVEGNHDFHVGPFFTETLQATVFTDDGTVQLDDTTIALSHGDTLAPTRSYLWLRGFFRSAAARFLIRIFPGDLTWKIGDILGVLSKKKSRRQPRTQYVLPEQAIRHQAQQRLDAGADLFVCGHFHQAHLWQQDKKSMAIVGNWGDTCHYGQFENGRFTLEEYHPAANPAT